MHPNDVMPSTPASPITVHVGRAETALADDVRRGLTATPKQIPPRWLYDPRGSALFERITELPEYYLTRAENEILTSYAPEIAVRCGASTLIELGSGTSDKTVALLNALRDAGTLRRFIAFDVAEPTLRHAVASLSAAYPTVEVSGVVGDFGLHLDRLPNADSRLVAFLGSTIGNLSREERARFLATVAARLRPGEGLLLGVDLVKDPARLLAAYVDGAGVTAEFEKNVLAVVNTALGADFDLDRFTYTARWDPNAEHISMGLRSVGDQTVRVADIGLTVKLADGEEIGTEISAKFRREGIVSELEAAGFVPMGWWTDSCGDFAVTLAQRAADPEPAADPERAVDHRPPADPTAADPVPAAGPGRPPAASPPPIHARPRASSSGSPRRLRARRGQAARSRISRVTGRCGQPPRCWPRRCRLKTRRCRACPTSAPPSGTGPTSPGSLSSSC